MQFPVFARFSALVRGVPAVAVGLLVVALGVLFAPVPIWVKVLFLIPTVLTPSFLVVAAALRQFFGDVSDIEWVNGPFRFCASNVRFMDVLALTARAATFGRRAPIPVARGEVDGSAADLKALREKPQVVMDAASERQEVPKDAAGITPVAGREDSEGEKG